MNTYDELTLRMALTRLPRLKPQHLRTLYDALGSAVNIYDNIACIDKYVPEATAALRDTLAMTDAYISWAQDETRYCHDHGIDILCHDDSHFPQLLNQCIDAPTILYSLGNADYNAAHIVASVGTRRCTEYGKAVCRRLYDDLGRKLPGTVVVSGLAYGIDIESHRAALAAGLPTVGVVAHGLDDLYPSVHRATANEMMRQGGGLLTEYPHATRIDKRNFVERNRIVAGMSHTTIVVESAAKGGAMITAEMANDYNREVFACPGRIYDTYSEGCNRLISTQKAHILTSMDTLLREMGWADAQQPIQGELFPTLSPEEILIRDTLMRLEEADIAALSEHTGISQRRLGTLMGSMEMDGRVSAVSGSNYYRWNI